MVTGLGMGMLLLAEVQSRSIDSYKDAPISKSVAQLSFLFPALISLPSQGLLFLLMECFQNKPMPTLSEKFFPEIICQLFDQQRLLSPYLLAMSFVWKHKNTLKIFVPLKELILWDLYHIEMLKTIIFFTKEHPCNLEKKVWDPT